MDGDFLKRAILASERVPAVSQPWSLRMPRPPGPAPPRPETELVGLSFLPASAAAALHRPRPASPPAIWSRNLPLCLTGFSSASCSSQLPLSLGGQGPAVDPEKRPKRREGPWRLTPDGGASSAPRRFPCDVWSSALLGSETLSFPLLRVLSRTSSKWS